MKSICYNTIAEMHKQWNYPPPENPLFSIAHKKNENVTDITYKSEDNYEVCITSDFYIIGLKKVVAGEIAYGKTKYDCDSGTLLFTAPKQKMTFKSLSLSSEAFHIAFHKDFLLGSSLFDKIKQYNFFGYHVNEALHLSPKEEELLKGIFTNINNEYHNNQDEFSKNLILSHLETLLQYADRFYKRQFLNRKELNQELFTQFTEILNIYFETGKLQEKGIPSVDWLAEQMGVSHRYMSDTIKAETGKTAVEQINLFLIEEAKNMLLIPKASISEIAYQLGFEYPQYFSRLFKKKVGVSPKQYIQNMQMN